ncbi:hypothetical protein PHMEG_00034684 [Phytophthora megakarya]|uniref:Uncharacterized protein n=1 Tax=Phytophthora megakarya TaxID=4795 RepID=A0A225UQU1_9STRA|nr:hypothetical protein PHMEG_00034684 [Phytophthora megakarya]
MATYYEAVNADTEAEFESQRKILASKSPVLATYLDLHWWKYKERVVRCWTKQYRHFGYQVTSQVEGIHAKCKRWLQTSRGSLLTVFQRLLPWWTSSARSLSLLCERNATIAPHRLQSNRYSAVVRVITIWALNATDKLWKNAETVIYQRQTRTNCSGTYRRMHGLPCIHELMRIIESNGDIKLKPSDFDAHWWVRRDFHYDPSARVEEPAIIRSSRKKKTPKNHRANQGASSTSRDPMLFERTDQNHPSTPPRRLNSSQYADAFQGTLPSIADLVTGYENQANAYVDAFTPARTWGHAGLR